MRDTTKQFVKDNAALLDELKYDEFYDKIFWEELPSYEVAEITAIIEKCEPDFLKNMTGIYPGMFYNYQGKTLTIPSSIQTIYSSAFEDTALESITIPASVEEVCEYAFVNCLYLKHLTIESPKTKFEHLALYEVSNLNVKFEGLKGEIDSELRELVLMLDGTITYKDGTVETGVDIR